MGVDGVVIALGVVMRVFVFVVTESTDSANAEQDVVSVLVEVLSGVQEGSRLCW